MTPEAQRIAIAEACPFVEKYGKGELVWRWQGRRIYFDPLNDLNAMHEAEMALPPEHRRRYLHKLAMPATHPWEIYYDEAFEHVTATAAQRAEAFLRTLGEDGNI